MTGAPSMAALGRSSVAQTGSWDWTGCVLPVLSPPGCPMPERFASFFQKYFQEKNKSPFSLPHCWPDGRWPGCVLPTSPFPLRLIRFRGAEAGAHMALSGEVWQPREPERPGPGRWGGTAVPASHPQVPFPLSREPAWGAGRLDSQPHIRRAKRRDPESAPE